MLLEDVFSLMVQQKEFFFNLTVEHLEISLIGIRLAIILD